MGKDLHRPRRPTMRDVADRAGVSKSLVALVMRGDDGVVGNEKRARVQNAATELGYRPRQRIARDTRSAVVPVLVADVHDLLLVDVADHIVLLLRDAGLEPVVTVAEPLGSGSGHHHARLPATRRPVSGGVIVGPPRDVAGVLRTMGGAPVVVAATTDADQLPVDVVRGDDALGMRLVIDYLISQGHRRIAHLGSSNEPADGGCTGGYVAAMRHHGLADKIVIAESYGSEDAGYRSTARLLRSGRGVSAITAVNDMTAIGALDAIADSGLAVPGDIAVAGYGDTYVAGIRQVSLTSVDPDRHGIAQHAVRCLLDRIAGADGPPHRRLLLPKLVLRASSDHRLATGRCDEASV